MEKRLIDSNGLKRRIIAFATAIKRDFLSIESIIDIVDTEQAIDAVEVVRCKDCKYWGQDVCSSTGDDESFCTNPDGLDNFAHPDDFCSYGKGEYEMPDYIEREKLLRDIEHYHVSDGWFQHLVEIQPTVDAAEVMRGMWISVKDRLPEPEQKVLVIANRAGFEIVTTGIYEDGRVTLGNSIWIWNDIELDYSEDQDDYIIPEGWWEDKEYNSDDEFNHPIDDTVTHWMPLPLPPEER